MQPVFFHEGGSTRVTEQTTAAAPVEVILNLRPAFQFVVNLQQCLPFVTQAGRHGVVEAVVDEPNKARHVEVRQVTARIPAAKAEFRSFGIGWTVPLPFVANGLKDVAAIRGHRSADSFVRANRRAKRFL